MAQDNAFTFGALATDAPDPQDYRAAILAFVEEVGRLRRRAEELEVRCSRYEGTLRWIAWWWVTAPDRNERPYLSEKRAFAALKAEGRDWDSIDRRALDGDA